MYLTKFDLLISHYRGKAGIATKNIPAQNARYLHHISLRQGGKAFQTKFKELQKILPRKMRATCTIITSCQSKKASKPQ